MSHPAFKVISVFSKREDDFDNNNHRNFFLLDYEKINCDSVEAFANYVKADLSTLAFRDRLIHQQKKVVTIPIGEKSTSRELVKYDGIDSETIEVSETKPYNKQFDGIIVDLLLYRHADRHIHVSDQLLPHGLGIVAWAVMHGIPVGLVYEESYKDRCQDFYIESVLDTLETHPCCRGKILSGTICDVAKGMYHYLHGDE